MFLYIIEILSVVFNLIYLVLLMQKKRLCWWFGFAGSALAVYLMYVKQLPGQSLIYAYYSIIAVYGWWNWRVKNENEKAASAWSIPVHILLNIGCVLVALAAAFVINMYTSEKLAYEDALLTSYGFVASFMQARKIISNWIYWFVIDSASAIVYFNSGMRAYALLMLVYAALCVSGYLNWKRTTNP